MTIAEFIEQYFNSDLPELAQSLNVALIILVVYLFYNSVFNAIFSHFKK